LARFLLVLVLRTKVEMMIELLIAENPWYKLSGVKFDHRNLENLLIRSEDHVAIDGVQITHLPSLLADESGGEHDWGDLSGDFVMENMAYTMGDHSSKSCESMKVEAMAHALHHGQFLSSSTSSDLVLDMELYLLSVLFPHLDLWGIGSFNVPQRSKGQHISFECQLKNLLRQADSPFAADTSFAFVCWNIIQKHEARENITFSIKSPCRNELASKLHEMSASVREYAHKCLTTSVPKAVTADKKGVT
ncbi:hypothetical protein M404DRAFT_162421, partial [Pisolithus tinctorius Marx 270]